MSAAEQVEAPQTALATIGALVPAALYAPGAIDDMLARIEREVRAVPVDVTTPAGRAACRSLAHKVVRSKTAMDNAGKELTEDWRKRKVAVDEERRTVRTRLDALAEEVRRPLDEFDAREAARVRAHEEALATLSRPALTGAEPAAEIGSCLAELRALPPREWEEFRAKAADTLATEIARLERLHAAAVTREAEAAELAQLRAERRAAAQAEREAEIARQAEERARLEERDRAEAARRAEADRAEEEARQLVAARQKAEREAAEAERRAKDAEAAQLAAEEQARRDLVLATETAAKATEKAERDRIAAEQAAVEAERRRVDAQARQQREEQEQRAASRAHRAAVNREALADLVAAGVPDPAARAAIAAIAAGKVRRISIQY